MPSAVQKKSYGSVTVFWLDRELAVENLKVAAERLAEAREEVLYVGLFGSLAEGRAVPGSDADLIVLVSHTNRRFLDRPLDYLPYFEDAGMGVDLFCYTPEEAERTPLGAGGLAKSLPLLDRRQGR